MFGMQSWIYRFANVVGDKSRKNGQNVITDFITKLKANPNELEILGDGNQTKSYLHVSDCIDGMLFGFKSNETVNIFNLSPGDNISVKNIAMIIMDELGIKGTEFSYMGGTSGWVGDVPLTLLSSSKMQEIGWKPKYNSREAVRKSVRELIDKYHGG